MLAQLPIFVLAEHIVGFLLLVVSSIFFLKVRSYEEDDETPVFSKVEKHLVENYLFAQDVIVKQSGKKLMGFVVGKWWIARVSLLNSEGKSNDPKQKYKITIVSFEEMQFLQEIDKNSLSKKEDKSKLKITTFGKLDNWVGGRLGEKSHSIPNTINQAQLDVVNLIVEDFKKNGRSVSLIYGPPGTGKTTIAKFVSAKLDAKLIYDYEPVTTGDSWNKFVHQAQDEGKPIVFLIDEIDIYLRKVKQGIPQSNKWCRPDVLDKPSWNRWFDFQVNTTDNLILIFTMNTPYLNLVQELDDTSFMRKGRVDMKIEFGDYPNFEGKPDFKKTSSEVLEKRILHLYNFFDTLLQF